MSQLLEQHNKLIKNLQKRDEIIQKSLSSIDDWFGHHHHHHHTINSHSSNLQQLHEDQVAIVTWMVGYKEKVCHCGDGSDHLSDLSYGEPVKTSSLGPSFPGHSTPSPVPIPAPVSCVAGQDIGLPSLSEGSSDKENSVPGSQQSSEVVSKLIPIIEEEHLDIGGESGHVMASWVQDEMVCLVLGQRCWSKAHASIKCHFRPYPHEGDGTAGFPFGHQRRGEQNIG